MPRTVLTDERWTELKPILLKAGVYDKPNLRMTLEGIIYRVRTGCPWRDVPEEFGAWNSIFNDFNRWSKQGKIARVFEIVFADCDTTCEFIDGSYIKAHQHAAGARKGEETAIGKSRGGYTTKIHLVVDSWGRPVAFTITAGNVNDCTEAPEVLTLALPAEVVVGDKGYDSESLRKHIETAGTKPVIPRKSNSIKGNDDMDWGMYRFRHLVENALCRLKHYRALATRYDKLRRNFASVVALACCVAWLSTAS